MVEVEIFKANKNLRSTIKKLDDPDRPKTLDEIASSSVGLELNSPDSSTVLAETSSTSPDTTTATATATSLTVKQENGTQAKQIQINKTSKRHWLRKRLNGENGLRIDNELNMYRIHENTAHADLDEEANNDQNHFCKRCYKHFKTSSAILLHFDSCSTHEEMVRNETNYLNSTSLTAVEADSSNIHHSQPRGGKLDRNTCYRKIRFPCLMAASHKIISFFSGSTHYENCLFLKMQTIKVSTYTCAL